MLKFVDQDPSKEVESGFGEAEKIIALDATTAEGKRVGKKGRILAAMLTGTRRPLLSLGMVSPPIQLLPTKTDTLGSTSSPRGKFVPSLSS